MRLEQAVGHDSFLGFVVTPDTEAVAAERVKGCEATKQLSFRPPIAETGP